LREAGSQSRASCARPASVRGCRKS
jgi:hypothetical protein